MGFIGTATAVSMLASAAGTAMAYNSSKKQAKQLEANAKQTLENGKEQAASITNTALLNNSRAIKNKQSQLAKARLDATSSGLAPSGSVSIREIDLSTKLQDEITNQTERALQDANLVYGNAVNSANDMKLSAQAAKTNSYGSLFSGVNNLATQSSKYYAYKKNSSIY